MRIDKKRVRNIEKYLTGLKENEAFFIALDQNEHLKAKLHDIGFTSALNEGETVLPKIKGPVSRFNAEGGFIRLRNLPKETHYRERSWEWKDWGGNHHSKIVYIPYERYQRKNIPPPSEELSLVEYADASLIISRKFIFKKEALEEILHVVNLFLELFSECYTVKENYSATDFDAHTAGKIIRLNWQVLPPGEYPWPKLKDPVTEITRHFSANRQIIINSRFETVSAYNPDFVAVGAAGFYGYLVFGFTKKNLYLLESVQLGNATYVFDKDWETLAQLTKAEILSENLQYDRLIHKEGWHLKIKNLLK